MSNHMADWGKLYGKVGGDYFDTDYTTDDWAAMEARIQNIEKAIDLIQKARTLNWAYGSDAHLQDAIIALSK